MELPELRQSLVDFTSSPHFSDLSLFAKRMEEFNLRACESYIKFRDDRYCRNLVFKNEEFELVLICWKPGQKTERHGHPENGCVMTVLDGKLKEEKFGSETVNKMYMQGEVSYIRGSEEHIISNDSSSESISLHIYSPPANLPFDNLSPVKSGESTTF